MSSATVVTWNVEWKTSRSAAAGLMRQRLLACEPDIVCINEGHTDFFHGEGHLIDAEADYGYGQHATARKTMLWSRSPWTDVDRVGDPEMPTGRFVAGCTSTPIGDIMVLGVCIPWRDAHVRSGRRDRKPWQDHVSFLNGLRRYLQDRPSMPMLIVGDYNQKVPRTRAPHDVYEALINCFGADLRIATAGHLPPDGKASIDHVAHSLDLQAFDLQVLSNFAPDGKRLSDHFGVSVRIRSGK